MNLANFKGELCVRNQRTRRPIPRKILRKERRTRKPNKEKSRTKSLLKILKTQMIAYQTHFTESKKQ